MMLFIEQLPQGKKGFTLVEIMIVTTIIGILAAIAVPLFSNYRINGFNASALSDTKNTIAIESSFYALAMSFGVSDGPVPSPGGLTVYGGSGGGIGRVITGPSAAGTTNTVTWTNNSGLNLGLDIELGNGVSIVACTEVPLVPTLGLSSFTVIGKHINGNTYYGGGSDVANVYWDKWVTSVGVALNLGNAVPSTTVNNDFTAPAVGPSGNPWQAR